MWVLHYVDRKPYHQRIKNTILAKSGDFYKKVGSNPDISVKNGKIVLTGVGAFNGKSFSTGLNADTYLKKKAR